MARFHTATIALLASMAVSVPAFAQTAQPAPPTVPVAASAADGQRLESIGEDQDLDRPLRLIFKDVAGDLVNLVSWRSVAPIGGAGLGALIVQPLDDELTSEPGHEWARWSEIFDPGTYIGNGLTLFGGALGTYAFGQITDRPRVAHVGRDLLRSIAVSQVLVHSLKLGISRDRPDLSSDNSFPSGHAATTFASAVVFQRHLGVKWAIPTYAVATYVAVSRMHENRHYLSDVVMGAGLGIASGLSTTRHATATWAMSPVFVPGGAAVMVTRLP